MDEEDEKKLSRLVGVLMSLSAVLRAYCYCHQDIDEIALLTEFAEIMDEKTNQLFTCL